MSGTRRNHDGDPEADVSGKSKGRGGAGEDESQQQGGAPKGTQAGPTTTQWVVGIASAVLVLSLLGLVVYEAVSGTSSPPQVTVHVKRVLQVPGGYMAEVTARNQGGSTAAALTIEGTLKRDTTTVETSTATISYVPAETERQAGLFFTKAPRLYTLEVRPMGYDRP